MSLRTALFLFLAASLCPVALAAAPALPAAPAAVSAAAPAPAPPGSRSAESFQGVASWYGAQFHGRTTSNGEIYDKNGMTAAHRSLPFGTLLRVTSLETGASVVVRVNDRGPFVAGRVLDLSEGAAGLIGMLATGTARVSCAILPPEEAAAFGSPPPAKQAASGAKALPGAGSAVTATGSCRVQVASYRDEKNAKATLERLRMAGLDARLEAAGDYRRIVFPAVPAPEVEALAARLREMGFRDLLFSWSGAGGK
ncbi:MAG: septal ring lytic transglycosylase RlpA family protein [Spirochaetaceae bacterium]|nr:septal ring lytic transglycosylase RlpA family protein [Spirochaetaceae bacterium]